MNDDQIEDLKQYFAVTISQATTEMATKSDLAVLQSDFSTLKGAFSVLQTHVDSRFDEILDSIAESLSVTNDSVDEQMSAHDLRITKLEQRTAH